MDVDADPPTATSKSKVVDKEKESKKRFEVKKVCSYLTVCRSPSDCDGLGWVVSGMLCPYGHGTSSLTTVPSVGTISWISVCIPLPSHTMRILKSNWQASIAKQTRFPPPLKNVMPPGASVMYVSLPLHARTPNLTPRSTACVPLPLHLPLAQNQECMST